MKKQTMQKAIGATILMVCCMLLPLCGCSSTAPAAGTCTVSICCQTALDSGTLSDAMLEVLPADGWILKETEVTFYEDETAFDVLQRVTKEHKIPMEATFTPLYNSSYIEGISNLYEFDCGDLSGWVYCINGEYPTCGSSNYQLADGDTVQWCYTCDMGRDVGGKDFSDAA